MTSSNSTMWTQPIDPFSFMSNHFLWWLWKWHDLFGLFSLYYSKSTKDMHFQPHNCPLLFPFNCSFFDIMCVTSRLLEGFSLFFCLQRSCRCECLIYFFVFSLSSLVKSQNKVSLSTVCISVNSSVHYHVILIVGRRAFITQRRPGQFILFLYSRWSQRWYEFAQTLWQQTYTFNYSKQCVW